MREGSVFLRLLLDGSFSGTEDQGRWEAFKFSRTAGEGFDALQELISGRESHKDSAIVSAALQTLQNEKLALAKLEDPGFYWSKSDPPHHFLKKPLDSTT